MIPLTTKEIKGLAKEIYALIKKDMDVEANAKKQQLDDEQDELLNIASLSRKLDVSYTWVKTRKDTLPRVKIGGTYRYPYRKCLEALMAEGRRRSAES